MPQDNTLFHLQNLTLSFQGRPALHHLSGSIRSGEMYAVLGPNGAGKSSFLRLLAGELNQWEGLFERKLPQSEVGYLAQTPLLNQEFPVTVAQVVSQGLARELPLSLLPFSGSQQDRIHHALEQVDLLPLKNEIWRKLSGGVRQRALIARLLVQNPKLLLLDEPFNSLDTASSDQLCSIFQNLHKQGLTLVVVLHDEDLARTHFTQAIHLNRDLNFWGPIDQLQRHPTRGISRLAPCPPPLMEVPE